LAPPFLLIYLFICYAVVGRTGVQVAGHENTSRPTQLELAFANQLVMKVSKSATVPSVTISNKY
jgi:hypothetical protein